VVTEQSLLTTIGTDMQQLTKKGMKNGFVALMAVLTRYRFRCIVLYQRLMGKLYIVCVRILFSWHIHNRLLVSLCAMLVQKDSCRWTEEAVW
jgi:hypothetical protein